MKFIVHNLRMIWARLSNSGWVLAELFLVFIVMWFLCDSLGCIPEYPEKAGTGTYRRGCLVELLELAYEWRE